MLPCCSPCAPLFRTLSPITPSRDVACTVPSYLPAAPGKLCEGIIHRSQNKLQSSQPLFTQTSLAEPGTWTSALPAGERFLTPWLLIIGSRAPQPPYVEVDLLRSGNEIKSVGAQVRGVGRREGREVGVGGMKGHVGCMARPGLAKENTVCWGRPALAGFQRSFHRKRPEHLKR
jgi:hypothetical protein